MMPTPLPIDASVRFTTVRRWLLLLGIWMTPPLVTLAAQGLGRSSHASLVPAYVGAVLLTWLPWVALTPWIFHWSHQHPLGSGRTLHSFLWHVIVSFVIGIVLTLYLAEVEWLLAGKGLLAPAPLFSLVLRAGIGNIVLSALLYWLVLAIAIGVGVYRLSQEREALLTQARLAALTSQVRPHFLFNTLHVISTLVSENPDKARQMIARLADLLRASLDAGTDALVPLREELRLIELYLRIQQGRFEDRLGVTIDVSDDVRDALVPHLLLQPLVENAIHHGISRHSTSGELAVRASHMNGRLHLRVEDDGPGPDDLWDDKPDGIGLSNTKARLEVIFGAEATLELQHRHPRGTVVVIDMPIVMSGEVEH